MRCLIVDDDPSPRHLMALVIQRSGHSATEVGDGNAAVHAMSTQSFDIAIVDMEMPGKNGASTIDSLRSIDPNLRILVVSGYDDRRHVLSALDAGADGYIVKDEIAASLADSIQSVRAGHTPLSPRVASIMLRQLRKQSSTAAPAPQPVARITIPRR